MSTSNKGQKAKYVSKQQREQFIEWYITNIGYNDNQNSRQLSERYESECGLKIPKLTIYRWLQNVPQDRLEAFASRYVNPELLRKPARTEEVMIFNSEQLITERTEVVKDINDN